MSNPTSCHPCGPSDGFCTFSGAFATNSGSSRNEPDFCCEGFTGAAVTFRGGTNTTESVIVVANAGRYPVPVADGTAPPPLFGGVTGSNHPIFFISPRVCGRVVIDLAGVSKYYRDVWVSDGSTVAAETIAVVLGSAPVPGDVPHETPDSARPIPRITLVNRSECPAYIAVGNKEVCGATVENVAKSIGARPRESISLFFDAEHNVWRRLDHA